MKKAYKRIMRAGFVFWTLIMIVSALFSILEDRSFAESLYWALITMSTVGYGDITPESGLSKFITICAIGTGLVFYVYMYTVLGGMFVEKQIIKKFGGETCNYKDHIIICGFDQSTEEGIRELISNQEDIAVITFEESVISAIRDEGGFPIFGNPTKTETLERAGIKNAKAIIVSEKEDSQAVLIGLIAKKCNRDINVVATVKRNEMRELLEAAGVTTILSSSTLLGRLMASASFEPHVADFITDITTIRGYNDVQEYKLAENSPLINKTVKDVLFDLKTKYDILLVSIVSDGTTKINPPLDHVIKSEDELLLLGNPLKLENFKQELNN